MRQKTSSRAATVASVADVPTPTLWRHNKIGSKQNVPAPRNGEMPFVCCRRTCGIPCSGHPDGSYFTLQHVFMLDHTGGSLIYRFMSPLGNHARLTVVDVNFLTLSQLHSTKV